MKRISSKSKINTKKNNIFKKLKKIRKNKKRIKNIIKEFFLLYIIKLFILLILISFLSYIYKYLLNKKDKIKILSEIKSFEDNLNLNQQTFYEFRKINSENKLIYENPKFKKSPNPDVTVVMTMYNQAHCIYKGLRSIQNQSLKNIEIIIIDDCSEDNSTDIIKEYQKEDPRIILIAHDINEGEIKSRSDGIRKAKGKYITIVDGDDALIHKDILKNSLFIAQKLNLDVVEFKGSGYRRGRPVNVVFRYNETEFYDIIYQPELVTRFTYKNGNNYELYNSIIWAKFVKNEVFQKVIDFIGEEFADDYINEAEDVIMAVAIFHVAQSYYTMKELGYYNSYDDKNGVFPKTKMGKCKINNKLKKFGFFKVCKFLVDKNNNNDKEKSMTFNFVKRENLGKILKMQLDERHYKILLYIYDKMLEWKCLNNEQRDFIIKQKNDVLNKKNNSK